jgi:hypothetical protein
VDRVASVFPVFVSITKVGEVRGEGVTIEKDGVIGVDGTDGFVDAVIECYDAGVCGIGGLIEGVVSSNPFVSFIVGGECLPEPYGAILEVFVVPD